MRRSGFTITELLIVSLILCIIAGVVYGAMAPAREKARQSQCISQLHQIYEAWQMYSADHPAGEQFAGMGDMQPLRSPKETLKLYGVPYKFWYCPDTPDNPRMFLYSTYELGLSIAPEDGLQPWADMVRELGPATPVLICTIHDEVYYLPREKDYSPMLARQFQIQLRLDGSIYVGRGVGARQIDKTRIRELPKGASPRRGDEE